jgi:hypothetical protein
MVRTALVAMAALVAVTAVQPAFARLALNRLALNRLALNTVAVNAGTGAADGISAIVLPGGEAVGR